MAQQRQEKAQALLRLWKGLPSKTLSNPISLECKKPKQYLPQKGAKLQLHRKKCPQQVKSAPSSPHWDHLYQASALSPLQSFLSFKAPTSCSSCSFTEGLNDLLCMRIVQCSCAHSTCLMSVWDELYVGRRYRDVSLASCRQLQR